MLLSMKNKVWWNRCREDLKAKNDDAILQVCQTKTKTDGRSGEWIIAEGENRKNEKASLSFTGEK